MRILFLYTELADYFLSACEQLSQTADVHIIRWPVNLEAPFVFKSSSAVKLYNRREMDLSAMLQLVQKINPELLVCSGWVDKDYLKIVRRYSGKIPTILTLDTQWKGSLKQRLALWPLRLLVKSLFSEAWVPGERQVLYAKKLGFKIEHIHTGFYCCDFQKFNLIYEQDKLQQTTLPKRFVYVGRYYTFKGISDLWQAYAELRKEGLDWELWCLGTGHLTPIESDGIKHFGFVQPADLQPILKQTGVFILPSRFEPWAVVVHEFATAGFPMILSHAVGASDAFLKEGENGYGFNAGDVQGLKTAMKRITELPEKTLTLMSRKSHELAQQVNPVDWINTLKKIYSNWYA